MHREALHDCDLACECWGRGDPNADGPCGEPAIARWYGGIAPRVEGDTIDADEQIPWAALACEQHDREMQAECDRRHCTD